MVWYLKVLSTILIIIGGILIFGRATTIMGTPANDITLTNYWQIILGLFIAFIAAVITAYDQSKQEKNVVTW